MRISTFGYVGKQGVKNIWRNKMFSLASIATMSACIFLFGLFFSILVNFQYIIKSAEEGVAITVLFNDDATEEQKKEQEKLLRKLRKAVETIEASLADLEKKIADYDRKFAEATQYNEADYKAYNELKAEYDHQMHEWEKASYELEITEGE